FSRDWSSTCALPILVEIVVCAQQIHSRTATVGLSQQEGTSLGDGEVVFVVYQVVHVGQQVGVGGDSIGAGERRARGLAWEEAPEIGRASCRESAGVA